MNPFLDIGLICSHSLMHDLLTGALAARGHAVIAIDPLSMSEPASSSIHGRCARCSVIVVCGWGMSRGGHHVVRHLCSVDPCRRVVLIEASSDRETAEVALRTGATAVIGADTSLTRTIDVIESAARGDSHVDMAADTTGSEFSDAWSGYGRTPDSPPLTLRETEILQLVVDGLDVRNISERLYISSKTVKHHLSSIYKKLGVMNRADAVVRGLKRRLVELPSE